MTGNGAGGHQPADFRTREQAGFLYRTKNPPEQRRLLERYFRTACSIAEVFVRLTLSRSIVREGEQKRELAERVGFEPTVEFPLHTLSKRAQSTTLTSLRLESTICEWTSEDYRTRRRSSQRGRDHLSIQRFELN